MQNTRYQFYFLKTLHCCHFSTRNKYLRFVNYRISYGFYLQLTGGVGWTFQQDKQRRKIKRRRLQINERHTANPAKRKNQVLSKKKKNIIHRNHFKEIAANIPVTSGRSELNVFFCFLYFFTTCTNVSTITFIGAIQN